MNLFSVNAKLYIAKNKYPENKEFMVILPWVKFLLILLQVLTFV